MLDALAELEQGSNQKRKARRMILIHGPMVSVLLGAGHAAHQPQPAGGDPYFANVVFLAGWEGSDGATSYNEEKSSRTATFVGNAQIDTAQSKFGSSSILFDGSGDRVTFANSSAWDLADGNSDQYTIEGWVRFNTLNTNNRGMMGWNGASAGTQGWLVTGSSTIGELGFSFTNDGLTFQNIVTSGASLTTGVWYAFCVDHDATGKIRIYVDGVMRASSTPANSAIGNVVAPLVFGAQGDAGSVDMDGWLDEVRITKGVARYASDSGYTPSATAFPRF